MTFLNMINIKDFDSSLLKIYKTLYKDIGIYNIGYITIKKIDDYENIYSVNLLYLMIGEVIGHIKKNNGNKYLVFDSWEENKEVLQKYFGTELKIKLRIWETEKLRSYGECEYGKDFTKILQKNWHWWWPVIK